MANTFVPIDVYAIVNEVAAQATGRQDLRAVDTSTFVGVGAVLTATQYQQENTLNAIGLVLSRTIYGVRPYRSNLDILRADEQRWGAVVRKLNPLDMDAEESNDYNTDLNPTQLADGQSIDMYKIKNLKVIELDFWGTKKLQTHITRYRDQLAGAFQSEGEFMRFIDAIMTEFYNSIERRNEARTRAVVINAFAGTYAMRADAPDCVVDVVAGYNDKKGTVYTRDELFNEHSESFLKYFVATIKKYGKRLKDSTSMYHANLTGKPAFLRHTPENLQRLLMYEPYFIDAETEVMPTVFNPDKLSIGDYQGVNFWQDPKQPEKINVAKANIVDVSDGASKDSGAVALDSVLGMLYDVEFMGVFPQFEYSSVTPFNSAGGYWNLFYHWRFNNWTDYSENHILFIAGPGGESENQNGESETYTEEALNALTVDELKAIARELEISGYSSMTKAQLVEAILAAQQ